MSSTKQIAGYLVVLTNPELIPGIRSLNPSYNGPNNIPTYPSTWAGELEAMDEYVFGTYKDEETGVILNLDRARELHTRFKDSPRRFELLFISNCSMSPPSEASPAELGYDVTGIGGEFYSLLADFPRVETFASYVSQLNEFGLFSMSETAGRFLEAYRFARLPLYDQPFAILRVWSVT